MTRSADGARNHLVALAEGARRVGLQINMDKTQCMATPSLPQDIIVPNMGSLEQVKCYKYLGSFMSSSAAGLNAQRGQKYGASWSMKQLWRLAEMPLMLRLHIFESTRLYVLLNVIPSMYR